MVATFRHRLKADTFVRAKQDQIIVDVNPLITLLKFDSGLDSIDLELQRRRIGIGEPANSAVDDIALCFT